VPRREPDQAILTTHDRVVDIKGSTVSLCPTTPRTHFHSTPPVTDGLEYHAKPYATTGLYPLSNRAEAVTYGSEAMSRDDQYLDQVGTSC
jgi:hypothetical protein